MSNSLKAPPPVVGFAYKRPDHLQRTLAALAAAEGAADTGLLIFCDGRRADADDETRSSIKEVWDQARAASGFRRLEHHFLDGSKGLAQSIVQGVTSKAPSLWSS